MCIEIERERDRQIDISSRGLRRALSPLNCSDDTSKVISPKIQDTSPNIHDQKMPLSCGL